MSKTPNVPGTDRPAEKAAGHWLLAQLGKKVLRPGGRETTDWLLRRALGGQIDVVEFAPGLGITAAEIIKRQPKTYTGVDLDPKAAEIVRGRIGDNPNYTVVNAGAQETGLPDASYDVVVGEAMLTMQGDKGKAAIVAEAVRVLRPGGRYAIHELALRGDRSPAELEAAREELSRTIRVGARPLPLEAWKDLLTDAGLVVEWTGTAPMHLLEPGRLVQDEGLLGAARFWRNVRRTPGARDRVRAMRQAFQLQGELLSAVGMVARRPQA